MVAIPIFSSRKEHKLIGTVVCFKAMELGIPKKLWYQLYRIPPLPLLSILLGWILFSFIRSINK